VIDTLRIGKFLTDIPKGPLWIVKQAGLQFSNPKLEVKKSLGGFFSSLLTGDLGPATGGALQPTRLYNLGINTLAQVPVNAFGVHFNRHGLLPVQDESTKYLAVVTANNKGNSKNNRLVDYLNTKMNVTTIAATKTSLLQKFINLIPIVKGFVQPKQQILNSYLGGPGSVYGIGTTLIKRYDYTTVHEKQNAQKPQLISKVGGNPGNVQYFGDLGVSRDYFYNPFDVTEGDTALSENNITNNGKTISPPSAITYTSNNAVGKYLELQEKIDKQSSLKQSYYDGNITGSYTGSFTTKNANTNRGASDYRYYGNRTPVTGSYGSKVTYGNTNVHARKDADILSIVFRAISPFTGKSEDKDRFAFSAYMKGFKDNFDGTWNDINYVGRSETFYLYNKFKRNVSFNLQIPCYNKIELFKKHRALGQLASVTAGAYNNDNILGGVLLKINVGNYLVGEYAVLNNLSYDIPDDTAWDVSDDALLAMNINASFNLTIVHKELPQYSPTEGFFGYLTNPTIPTSMNSLNQNQNDSGFFISSTKLKQFSKD
jgi:hypothetical protein